MESFVFFSEIFFQILWGNFQDLLHVKLQLTFKTPTVNGLIAVKSFHPSNKQKSTKTFEF